MARSQPQPVESIMTQGDETIRSALYSTLRVHIEFLHTYVSKRSTTLSDFSHSQTTRIQRLGKYYTFVHVGKVRLNYVKFIIYVIAPHKRPHSSVGTAPRYQFSLNVVCVHLKVEVFTRLCNDENMQSFFRLPDCASNKVHTHVTRFCTIRTA